MKKLLSLAMGIIVMLSSCSKNVNTNAPVLGEEINVSLNLSMADNLGLSRAFEDAQSYENMRLVVAVLKNGVIVDSVLINGWNGTAGKETAVNLTLVSGQEYSFYAWADFAPVVELPYESESTHGYYGVSYKVGTASNQVGVTNLSIYSEDRGYGFNGVMTGSDKNADAFYGAANVTFTSTDNSLDITLGRPFGLVKINTLDIESNALVNSGMQPATYKLTTTSGNIPVQFRPLSANEDGSGYGLAVTHAGVKNVVIEGKVSTTGSELSFDYFFAKEGEQTLIDFTVEYFNAEGESITSRDFENIPVQRNYITNITGNVLTTEGSINVTLDTAWGGNTNTDMDGNIEVDKEAIAYTIDGDFCKVDDEPVGKVFSEDEDSYLVVAMTYTDNETWNEATANAPKGWRLPSRVEVKKLIAAWCGEEYIYWDDASAAASVYGKNPNAGAYRTAKGAFSEGLTDPIGEGGYYTWTNELNATGNPYVINFDNGTTSQEAVQDEAEGVWVQTRYILEVTK